MAALKFEWKKENKTCQIAVVPDLNFRLSVYTLESKLCKIYIYNDGYTAYSYKGTTEEAKLEAEKKVFEMIKKFVKRFPKNFS